MLRWVAGWSLWRLPPLTLAVLLAVELAAVALPCTVFDPITRSSVWLAVLLATLALGYYVLVAGWERARRANAGHEPPVVSIDLLATWTFAAAVLLPMRLAALVVLVTVIGGWRCRLASRPAEPLIGHRYAYSSAAVLCSVTAAHLVVRADGDGIGLLLLAAAAYLAVESAVIALLLAMTGRISQLAILLFSKSGLVEVSTLLIGVLEVQLSRVYPPLIWLSLPIASLVHYVANRAERRSLYRNELQPLPENVWLAAAREVVNSCPAVAILRVCSDEPHAVAHIARLQAGCETIGRIKGTGLAILLADCPAAEAESLAMRIRSALIANRISAQVSVVSKPRDGQNLDQLLALVKLPERADSSA